MAFSGNHKRHLISALDTLQLAWHLGTQLGAIASTGQASVNIWAYNFSTASQHVTVYLNENGTLADPVADEYVLVKELMIPKGFGDRIIPFPLKLNDPDSRIYLFMGDDTVNEANKVVFHFNSLLEYKSGA